MRLSKEILTRKLSRLREVNARLKNSLKDCAICPRRCHVNRYSSAPGYCKSSEKVAIYNACIHHGEEPAISGSRGSGTIFFSRCNMRCAYCQNYKFSQLGAGDIITNDELARIMLDLQERGCHNINLVSPTHFLPQILDSLEIAVSKSLCIPIVYNTGGYELPEVIKLLDGIVDIYLPDMRYSNDASARMYSDASDYTRFNRSSILEMSRQVDILTTDKEGIAVKGLIIRLLALPDNAGGTMESLRFISKKLPADTFLSIMSQYYPAYRAFEFKELAKPIASDEFQNIVDEAKLLGLNKGWVQDSPDGFDPRFFGSNIKRDQNII